MSTRAMRLLTWGVAVGLVPTLTLSISIRAASAQPTQLLDAAGVMHLTNVPADPRYRDLPTGRGSGAGWLRLPDRSLRAHAEIIDEIARRYGVSARLVDAVVRVESGFDRIAVSPKGAGGLMQLMPDTAAALGVTDRFDARQNITGGVRHLRYLLDRYQGSVTLALAAYNAGEGVVDAYRGVPPYPETQQYVRRVLGEAGLEAAGHGAARALYRYQGPDDTLTYSNMPPPRLTTNVRRGTRETKKDREVPSQ
jgi:soluble lytic murein transglycosylase-like protein